MKTQIKMGKKRRRVLSEAFPTHPHAAPLALVCARASYNVIAHGTHLVASRLKREPRIPRQEPFYPSLAASTCQLASIVPGTFKRKMDENSLIPGL